MASTKTVTTKLRAEGFPVELVRGNGYLYFIFDNGSRFETYSIYTPRFNDLTEEQWLEEGRDWAKIVLNDIAEEQNA